MAVSKNRRRAAACPRSGCRRRRRVAPLGAVPPPPSAAHGDMSPLGASPAAACPPSPPLGAVSHPPSAARGGMSPIGASPAAACVPLGAASRPPAASLVVAGVSPAAWCQSARRRVPVADARLSASRGASPSRMPNSACRAREAPEYTHEPDLSGNHGHAWFRARDPGGEGARERERARVGKGPMDIERETTPH